ncbi:YdeI/OmpD-associated family protein [Candidatus Pacearchaeota archaeon]|nr:YdeI/OmpD-associated family protein [Candidatus Pacearchaeota archaeon]
MKKKQTNKSMINKEDKIFYPRDRKEWRQWLMDNHVNENKISMIRYKKHTGQPSVTHRDAMEEAICFGWIDTTIKRLDDKKYIIRFVKRTKKSRWSNNTLSYAKKLIEEKKMTPHGLQFYEEGLKKPVIDFPVKNPLMPDDLKVALLKNNCFDNFEKLAPSHKRTYIVWIERAKLPETRQRRIAETVKRVKQNKKFMD